MILNMIWFKNVKINAFTNPNYTDVEPEKAAQGLERAIIANFDTNPELIKAYENVDMYYFGTFDDETGIFKLVEPVYLCSPREIILKLVAEKVSKLTKKSEEKKEASN